MITTEPVINHQTSRKTLKCYQKVVCSCSTLEDLSPRDQEVMGSNLSLIEAFDKHVLEAVLVPDIELL